MGYQLKVLINGKGKVVATGAMSGMPGRGAIAMPGHSEGHELVDLEVEFLPTTVSAAELHKRLEELIAAKQAKPKR
jgi:hypothetical protein